MTRLQALGDSFTCGQGVGVQVPLSGTWAALLATGLGLEHRSLAVAGSRVRDVLDEQLPLAEVAVVSTLLVGLNDAARGGFDPVRLRARLLESVSQLAALSGAVVVGRLHDPSQVLWMPYPLARALRRRVERVNEAVAEAARFPRVVVLDLGSVPELQEPSGWAVDRVHPSAAGHRGLARAAAATLGHELPAPAPATAPGLVRRATWALRHGAPYLAGQVLRAPGPVMRMGGGSAGR